MYFPYVLLVVFVDVSTHFLSVSRPGCPYRLVGYCSGSGSRSSTYYSGHYIFFFFFFIEVVSHLICSVYILRAEYKCFAYIEFFKNFTSSLIVYQQFFLCSFLSFIILLFSGIICLLSVNILPSKITVFFPGCLLSLSQTWGKIAVCFPVNGFCLSCL